MSGWIKIHRKITENPLYFSEPFNRSMAWIDMLLLANHSENFFFKRGIRVDVCIGQIGYDVESLAKRWQWSRGKVERFLQMLEKDKQIVRQKTNVTTLISIVNYKEYQQDSKANNKADSKANDKANGHKQELKELKEENINIDGFVLWFNKMLFKYRGKEGKFKKLSKTDINNLKQLKELKFENSDWEKAFITMSKNQWVMDNNMCNPSHYLRNDNFQKYLNQYEPDSTQEFKFAHDR